jgi:hypothetical protein
MPNRTPISVELASDVMFMADRTVCVCRERGKTIQIHHIDENPSNSIFENLAVLCLECHNDTQIKGGFGRKLNSDLVIKYHNEWLERVKRRRDEADQTAISKAGLLTGLPTRIDSIAHSEERSNTILDYVNSLPALRNELRSKAQLEWDSGVTARMVSATYEYVAKLQGVLIRLASFYPKGNFGGDDPHKFFSELIASRYAWHRSHAEPYGPGTGGTIVNGTTSGHVAKDVEEMVEDMAQSLIGYDDRFEWREWPKLWNQETI